MRVTAKKGLPPEVQKRIREMYWTGYKQGELDTLKGVLEVIRADKPEIDQIEVAVEAMILALSEKEEEEK